MGKTVYCISNGSPDMFPNNTLTSFGNKFPFIYDYGKASNNIKLQVGVDAIGFSLNFNGNTTNIPDYMPNIIIVLPTTSKTTTKCHYLETEEITRCDLKQTIENSVLDHIEKEGETVSYVFIYLKEKTLNFDKLRALFNRYHMYYTLNASEEKKTLAFTHQNHNVYFYIQKHLLEQINVKTNFGEHFQGKSTTLQQEQVDISEGNTNIPQVESKTKTSIYESYKLYKNSSITLNLNKEYKVSLPKIIKVRCKNIRDQIFNDKSEKDLLVFCPQIENLKHNYFFHEFETRTYCTLENTILDRIYFEILNEYNIPLQLDTGVPTLLKLDIKAMDKNKKSFNIRIASDQTNRSNFSVKLPQTLFFNENWRVSLTSINLPNTFTTFNFTKPLKITFFYQSGDYLKNPWGHAGDNFYDKKIEFELPNKIYKIENLLDLLNSQMSQNADQIEIGKFEEFDESGGTTKKIKFLMKYHGRLDLPEELVLVLGDLNRGIVVTEDGIVTLIHVHEYEENLPKPVFTKTFEFLHQPNAEFFKPSYIMLYSDVIQPIAVSGIFMNIMKIFPISPENVEYVIKEFKNPEYLALNNYEIKEMAFQLRNHTGDFISFDSTNPNPVILNLHFTNY